MDESAVAGSPTDEWSALGSRDIDHKTRGARVRARAAIESIRRGGLAGGRIRRGGSLVTFFGSKPPMMPVSRRGDFVLL
jgi:hypothetical protein